MTNGRATILELCGKKYVTMDEIDADFNLMNKKDLKENVATYINLILNPVREHFEKPELKILAEKVASYRINK